MKRRTAYILAGVTLAVLIAYLAVSLGVVSKQRHELTCTGVSVTVRDSSRHAFITSKDVMDCIHAEYGTCTGKVASEIDLAGIERIIKARNAVLSAEAFISSNGILNIKVVQRTPVLRFKNSEEDFLTDSEGYIFHLKAGAADGVTTVGGHIPVQVGRDFRGELSDSTDERWIRDMIALSRYVKRTGYWNNVSINVRSNRDVTLQPVGEKVTFVIGWPDNFRSKFARIGRYYSTILPDVGENYYSTVSVKFAGQIICKK
ncbi:MAG: hypothetical protein LUC24_04165 [Bacteroidales bacterium]|nr:hypothetical protein [Bacteroidales bacterium]